MTKFAVLLLILVPLASAVWAVTLVTDGKPVAAIVIADKAFQAKRYELTLWANGEPEAKARAAAEDLQKYIEKISGATLPIVSDAALKDLGGAVIYVGESEKTKTLPLKIPRGVTNDFKEEGYTLYARGNTLALVGNDAGPYHGTEYAVVELLTRLGCRWYMPTTYGEYLPAMKTIAIRDVTFSDTPDFRQRCWWQNGIPEMQAADAEFKIRNKMSPLPVVGIAGDGTIRQWLPDKEYLKTKPEYFAKSMDGSINEYMVNLTNPDVPALVAAKMKVEIKAQLDKGIAVPQVSIAPDDGIPIDFTRETMDTNLGLTGLCGRLNVPTEVSMSEEWFRFVNKVAAEVGKDYPNALILTNGYANRDIPPQGVTLQPNVAVMYAAIWADVLHPLNSPKSWHASVKRSIIQQWCRINSRVTIYDYDMQMLVTAITPVPGVHKLAVAMPLMKQFGLAGFIHEARHTYMEEGIQTKYLRARMMWDADLNVKDVLDDYYTHWYGAAAVPAQAFWNDLEENQEQSPLLGHEDRVLPFVYTPALLAKLEKDVTMAEGLAADDRSKLHVRADRLILEHLKSYMAMHDAEFAGRYAEAARQADAMLARRAELEAISPFYCTTKGPNKYVISGDTYWGVSDRKAHYLKLDDMMNGKTGALIAMAPQQAAFRLDPGEIGHLERWYEPDYPRKDWQKIDTCKPFYLQAPGAMDARGILYQGFMWYVFELPVPAAAKGKPIHVYSPIVVDDAWVWVNGQFVGKRGHLDSYWRPAPVEFDVTPFVQPGKTNIVAVRVTTGFNNAGSTDGFMGRLFLYSPVNPE